MKTEQIEKFDSKIVYGVEFITVEDGKKERVVLNERDIAILAERLTGQVFDIDKGVNILNLFGTLQKQGLIIPVSENDDLVTDSGVNTTNEETSVDGFVLITNLINSVLAAA